MKYIFTSILFLLFSPISYLHAENKVVAAYFAEWGIYGRNYHVADIPGDKLTHVIYAFAQISPHGEVALFDPYAATEKSYPGDKWDEELRGNFKQLKLLKQKYPHLKMLIAIGGWTLSDPFTDVALTRASRAKFARSAINFVEKYDFDGIDIDWEYPVGGGISKGRPEDKQNATLLFAELKRQLLALETKKSQKYFLTAASPAGDQLDSYELAEVAKYIDWYNLMAYDFHGAWDKQTNHQAALHQGADPSGAADRYFTAGAVKRYIEAGVAPSQIVLGIPLYSRGWSGVSSNNNGLFQDASGPSDGTWEPGILDYSALNKKVKENPDQYLLFREPESKAAWVFNPYLGNGSFYTYEDIQTVNEKIQFIKQQNLRGAMFWELSSDIRNANDPESIIGAFSTKFL